MILQRLAYTEKGIFGTLRSEEDEEIAVTLEHAYENYDRWIPKVPSGRYICRRGIHQLSHGAPFETFEITGIYGHSGILFHVGNKNEDSSGCVLLGEERVGDVVLRSLSAFSKFIEVTKGFNEFPLIVV